MTTHRWSVAAAAARSSPAHLRAVAQPTSGTSCAHFAGMPQLSSHLRCPSTSCAHFAYVKFGALQ